MNTRDEAKKGLKWGCCSAAGFGLLMLGAWAVTSVIWYPHGHKVPQTTCMNNLKQVGMAIELYGMEWGDRRPPLYTTSQRSLKGQAWPDLLMPYLSRMQGPVPSANLEKVFRCPDAPDDRLSYALNPRIAGLRAREIKYPSSTIAVFDSVSDSPENNNLNGDTIWRPSDGGVPGVGCLPLWPEREPLLGPKLPEWASPRHHGSTMVLWVDGHVTSVDRFVDPTCFAPVKAIEN